MLVALVALLQQATYTGILISGSKRKGKTGNSMNLSFNIWNLQIVLYFEAWKPALQEKKSLFQSKQGSFEFVGLYNHLQLKVSYGIGGVWKKHAVGYLF